MAKIYGKGRGLTAMKNSVSALGVQIKGLADLGARRLDRGSLERYIVAGIAKMVHEALERSLAKSGVKRDSGALKAAVKSAVISIGKDKLLIGFRSSLPNKLLQYASSINYGSVRNAGGLGKRARKTLKTAVLKDRALSERELRRFTKGLRQVHDGRIIKRGTFQGRTEADARKLLEGKLGGKATIGGTTIILPKPYFYLSAADKKAIGDKFIELYERYLKGTLERPKAKG